MTHPKPNAESDAARSSKDADRNREKLVENAEKSIADSKEKKPQKPA